MSKPTNGGTAFPSAYDSAYEGTITFVPGMTLRQYYKAKATQGLLAFNGERNWANLATQSSAIADALIAEDEAFEKRVGDDA